MGVIGVLWGITGVSFLLGFAIYRLTPLALDAMGDSTLWYHWIAIALNVVFMAYSEGYRGFQKSFSPRVAARCRYLYDNPNLIRVLLAPFFCVGYFDTTRRRQITVIAIMTLVIILVIIVQRIEQPWRGIIDAGVVIGLLWGLLATWVYTVLAFVSKEFAYSPELE